MKKLPTFSLTAFGIALAILLPLQVAQTEPIRIGMIGLDTSHVVDFTEILHNEQAANHVSGARVIAAYKGGSPDIPSSWDKVEGYTKTLQDKYGVTIYDTIEEVCAVVDAVMIESVDGRPHLEQARKVIASGKPLYIDKPVAGTLADAVEIFRLAREANVPLFTSSSLRFAKNTQEVRQGSLGKILHAETFSPAHLEPHHPDLFWYGVHGCESLFTVMGPGCETVERRMTDDGKIEVLGTWCGGRTGIFREKSGYGGLAKGETGEGPVGSFDGYAPMIVEVVKFFQTGISPVMPKETLELFAFMEAADESKRQGGKPVSIQEILRPYAAQIP